MVLVIVTIITSVAITSQGSFNKSLVLSNAAYDLALTIRSAETFGLGSRASSLGVNAGYGLHLQSGTTGSFTLFADTYPNNCSSDLPSCNAGDHAYQNTGNPVTSDIRVQTYSLGNGIYIQNFCARSNNAWECSSPPAISSLDIVFERPNPNALMSKNGLYSQTFPVTLACIILASPQGGAKYITVGSSGQIITNATASSCGL